MIVAFSADAWTEVIVALSIFIPVLVTIAISIVFLRSAKDDPDEQRWRRLAEQRREADTEDRG